MKRCLRRLGLSTALALGLTGVAAAGDAYSPEETAALARIGVPEAYPEQDAIPPKQVELGRELAFDPRLSSNGAVSCMSCHQPGFAFTDALPRSRGVGHQLGRRNTPTLLNLQYRHSFFWDGRATSIEAALLDAVKNPVEMNQPHALLAARLRAVPGYASQFETVYGTAGVTTANMAAAIGAFVRTIDIAYTQKTSAYDKFRDDPSALSASARRGLVLFAGKARCAQCHATDHFADDRFHNVGLAPARGDKGRAEIEPGASNLRAFKTPSLRQVALTAPYMHDGRLATLRDVVDFFDRGGDDKNGLDPEMRPLGLTGDEKNALVDFLRALTAETPVVTVPALPPQ